MQPAVLCGASVLGSSNPTSHRWIHCLLFEDCPNRMAEDIGLAIEKDCKILGLCVYVHSYRFPSTFIFFFGHSISFKKSLGQGFRKGRTAIPKFEFFHHVISKHHQINHLMNIWILYIKPGTLTKSMMPTGSIFDHRGNPPFFNNHGTDKIVLNVAKSFFGKP